MYIRARHWGSSSPFSRLKQNHTVCNVKQNANDNAIVFFSLMHCNIASWSFVLQNPRICAKLANIVYISILQLMGLLKLIRMWSLHLLILHPSQKEQYFVQSYLYNCLLSQVGPQDTLCQIIDNDLVLQYPHGSGRNTVLGIYPSPRLHLLYSFCPTHGSVDLVIFLKQC